MQLYNCRSILAKLHDNIGRNIGRNLLISSDTRVVIHLEGHQPGETS